MPSYSFNCENCGHRFDASNNIINRDLPTQEPCPSCGTDGSVRRTVTAPKIVSGSPDHIGSKIPAGFRDVLKNIKKGSGKHCTIDV